MRKHKPGFSVWHIEGLDSFPQQPEYETLIFHGAYLNVVLVLIKYAVEYQMEFYHLSIFCNVQRIMSISFQ